MEVQEHMKQQLGKYFRTKDQVFTEQGVFVEWSSSVFDQKMQIK